MKTTLVYGYGNPGRQDDGLGAAFIQKMERWIQQEERNEFVTDCNYQLNIEDAELISTVDRVIFVDASIEPIETFAFTSIDPDPARVEFSMHAVSPAFVVDLCRKMFGKAPEAWLLHIKGYEWDFKEELSLTASENLNEAFTFLTQSFLIEQETLINH